MGMTSALPPPTSAPAPAAGRGKGQGASAGASSRADGTVLQTSVARNSCSGGAFAATHHACPVSTPYQYCGASGAHFAAPLRQLHRSAG